MTQRKSEWFENITLEYHLKQYEQPYRSTEMLCEWLNSIVHLKKQNSILDLCCGAGANIFYMKEKYHQSKYYGVELNDELVKLGNRLFIEKGISDCKIKQGDIYNLDDDLKDKFDGITMYQTLSWLPEYKEALLKMFELNPKWIALSSLFYDGMIDCKIEVTDYNSINLNGEYRKCYYNIFSIPMLKKFCKENGYRDFKYIPFNIDIDVPNNNDGKLGTYTEKLINGKRIQISGPILMSWYFIFIGK